MSFSEKMFRFLLRAYPQAYRDRYAEPMEQLFRDRLRKVHALGDLTALWGQTLADWTGSVLARHWEELTGHLSLLTDPARRCFFFARLEASSFSRREITVEHLLLGVLREEPSLLPVLARDAVVRTIESNEPTGRRVPQVENLRLSEEAIRVVAAARRFARGTGREAIVPADLAAGILRETDTLAGRLLRDYFSDCT